MSSTVLIVMLFAMMLAMIFIGVPVAFSVGISALAALMLQGIPLTQLITKMFGGVDSFTVLAIPFYILVGSVMNSGDLTAKLVKFADSLVGHVRGGLAHVNVLASMFFAGISGSSTADSASIGAMLVPAMEKEGYDIKFAAAITAASSSIGPIIPPSIMMVLYGSLTGVSVGALFLGGIGPGILLGLLQMALTMIVLPKVFHSREDVKKEFRLKKVWSAFLYAFPVLVIPLIIVSSIVGGICTATEAGVLAAAYSIVISLFFYKTIKLRQMPAILLDAAKSTGIVLFLMSTAAVFGNVLTLLHFPEMCVNFLYTLTDNPTVMLFIVIGFLFMLGFFIDGTAIMIMFVPVLNKIASAMNYDPIFFGVIVTIAILIGGITPPVGVLLFVNAKIAKISMDDMIRGIWPFVVVMLLMVILCALVPSIITFIPNALM